MFRRRPASVAASVAAGAPSGAPSGHVTDALAGAQVGSTVRVTGVDIAGGERLRLAEFGLRPGALVRVLARTAGGGHLVALGTSRIVLDDRTAGRLVVQAA